jgi:transcriptional regulator with XRE-family HTH domain
LPRKKRAAPLDHKNVKTEGSHLTLCIGENIRQLRTDAGLTQRALAHSLKISIQAVSKWEQNRSYPDITMLPAIAELFSVSIDRLFQNQ